MSAHRQLPTGVRELLARLRVGLHQQQGIQCGWGHTAQEELPSCTPQPLFCRTAEAAGQE